MQRLIAQARAARRLPCPAIPLRTAASGCRFSFAPKLFQITAVGGNGSRCQRRVGAETDRTPKSLPAASRARPLGVGTYERGSLERCIGGRTGSRVFISCRRQGRRRSNDNGGDDDFDCCPSPCRGGTAAHPGNPPDPARPAHRGAIRPFVDGLSRAAKLRRHVR